MEHVVDRLVDEAPKRIVQRNQRQEGERPPPARRQEKQGQNKELIKIGQRMGRRQEEIQRSRNCRDRALPSLYASGFHPCHGYPLNL